MEVEWYDYGGRRFGFVDGIVYVPGIEERFACPVRYLEVVDGEVVCEQYRLFQPTGVWEVLRIGDDEYRYYVRGLTIDERRVRIWQIFDYVVQRRIDTGRCSDLIL